MHIAREVLKDANDDTARIYPGCLSEDGAWVVKRRENAFVQQISVIAVCCAANIVV